MDYLVIGHITQDLTPSGPRLGGTAAYAALTAAACGLRIGLVTSAAPDVRADELAHLPALRLPAERSTTFENLYTAHGRVQRLHALALPLGAASVPLQWRRAPIVHLGPVAREVDGALVGQFPGSLVGLTPQGWMREWDEAGAVRRGEWAQAPELITKATATVLSLEDVAGDWAVLETWAAAANVLVVTQGPKGATVFWGGERRDIPVTPMPETDPTGAGDIFAAAFFIRLWETRDAWEAARFANCVAARSVTRVGLAGVPTADEVEACRGRV